MGVVTFQYIVLDAQNFQLQNYNIINHGRNVGEAVVGIYVGDVELYLIKFILPLIIMSFQNSIGPDGSININVIPSFGRIVQVSQNQRVSTISEVERWRQLKGALHHKPADFDPSRYASFSTREVVEDPVDQEHIHEYVEKSRLSRRLGW